MINYGTLFLAFSCLIYAAWEYRQGAKEYGSWLWFFEKDKTPDVES